MLSGPTAPVFLAHAKRHTELGTPVIILENVQAGLGLEVLVGPYPPHSRITPHSPDPGEFVLLLLLLLLLLSPSLSSLSSLSLKRGLLQELPLDFVDAIYGEHYTLHPLFVQPGDLGHTGAARKRLYVILAHRDQVALIYNCQDMYKKISDQMHQLVTTEPHDYLIASDLDIRLEVERVALRRKVKLRPKAVIVGHKLTTCLCLHCS